MKLTAHRGYRSEYPENTMLAFREALKLDIDMIETDVHMTKDGEIVIMHDGTVDRTTDGTGRICDRTLAEIRALDAGIFKGERFAGEKVPTLREFLELMKSRPDVGMIIELKDYVCDRGESAFACCDKTLALLEEYGVSERTVINSSSGELLLYVADRDPKYRLEGYYPLWTHKDSFDRERFYSRMHSVCLFDMRIEDGKKINTDCPPEKKHFDFVRSFGAEAWVYFSEDTPEKIKTAYENGASAITCNDPLYGGRVLDEIGARKLKQ